MRFSSTYCERERQSGQVSTTDGRRARRIQGAHTSYAAEYGRTNGESSSRPSSRVPIVSTEPCTISYGMRPSTPRISSPIHPAEAAVPAKPDGISAVDRSSGISVRLRGLGRHPQPHRQHHHYQCAEAPCEPGTSSGFNPSTTGNHHRGCRRQRVQNSVCRRYHTGDAIRPGSGRVESYYPCPPFPASRTTTFPACPDTRIRQADLRLDYYLTLRSR